MQSSAFTCGYSDALQKAEMEHGYVYPQHVTLQGALSLCVVISFTYHG